MVKTMFNSKNISRKFLLLAALLLFIPVSPVKSQNSPPSSFEDYRKTCLQRAAAEGLPKDIAQDLCNCTIKRFQSQYTLAQFRALVEKSNSDRNAQRTLTQVGEACLDQVLYE